MKEAEYFTKKENNVVQCILCPHLCVIKEDNSGICGARRNKGGILYSVNYGVISGMSFDPIEKKPLYHYYPSSQILSIGTVGCNMRCPFCQNYHISRFFDSNIEIEKKTVTPKYILDCLQSKNNHPSGYFGGVAYTYSEPMVWYEFVKETSILLKEHGFKNVLVTNGYINKKPLMELLPFIDAANIDLKAFTEEHYKKLGGSLKPVLDTITAFKEKQIHVELTTLVVTAFNDNMEELENLVKWIASLDKNIPYHISRYFPQYLYNERETDPIFLNQVKKMADHYLNYVYLGNISGESDTYCPQCKSILVEREGYYTRITGIKDGKCIYCGRKADFVI